MSARNKGSVVLDTMWHHILLYSHKRKKCENFEIQKLGTKIYDQILGLRILIFARRHQTRCALDSKKHAALHPLQTQQREQGY